MSKYNKLMEGVDSKGGVEDTTLDAKNTKKTRLRTDFLRTDHFEAKNRNARGQSQERYIQVLSKNRKKRSSL